jgi:hypothetical protein
MIEQTTKEMIKLYVATFTLNIYLNSLSLNWGQMCFLN